MRWRVSRVEAGDLFCWETLDWSLEQGPHVSLIVGDRGTGRSNGSGKSTLFDIIAWVIYGQALRRLKTIDKVRRRGADPKAKSWGRVTIDFSDGRSIVVERSRSASGAALNVSGFDANALASGAQTALDGLLGDFATFTMTAMFSGAIASFCRMGDAQRKEVLERMLQVDRYTQASDRARDMLAEAEEDQRKATTALELAKQRLALYRERRAEIAYTTFVAPLRDYRRLRDLRKRAIALAEKARAAWLLAKDEEAAFRAKEADLRREREEAQTKVEDAQEVADQAVAAHAKYQSQVEALNAKIRELQTEIDNVSAGDHPDVCPECGQRWPHEHDPSAVAEIVAKKKTKIAELKQQRAEPQAQAVELLEKATEAKARLSSLKIALREKSTTSSPHTVRALYTAVFEQVAEMEAVQRDVLSLESSLDPEDQVVAVADVDEQIEAAHRDIAKAEGDLATASLTVDDLKFWRLGFGRSGLPSYLVDSAVPAMNEVAGTVASLLSDGELSVSFDPAAAKGTKSVFEVAVDYRDGGEGFDAASTGEKTRVDMAVLFALRDLAARRSVSECSQLFLDEVMDGSDEHFVTSFVSMLRSQFKDYGVYLISHDPSTASLVDHVLTVRRRGSKPAKLLT